MREGKQASSSWVGRSSVVDMVFPGGHGHSFPVIERKWQMLFHLWDCPWAQTMNFIEGVEKKWCKEQKIVINV